MVVKSQVKEVLEQPALDDTELLKNLRRIRIANIWTVRVFFTVFFAVSIIALIIPLRPTYSENEKRELNKFPTLSAKALFSGEFFIDIDKWYSDTFPERDFFTDINAKMTMLYGKSSVIIHGEVESGDDIPSIDSVPESSNEEASSDSNSTSSDSTVTSENESPVSSTPPTATEPPASSTPPPVTSQTLGALLINGDSAYEYYNFVKSTSDSYAATINRAAFLLTGKAQVYSLIAPTSMAITAPDELVASVNTSDQKTAIDYIYSQIYAPAKTVNLYNALKPKRNEYIYFRTDHHWTALGAYYSYCEFAASKGITPMPLDSYTKYEFGGFLGTFYSGSKKLPQLASNPDTVYAYGPSNTNVLSLYSPQGYWYPSTIISDMTNVSASSKYMTFIKGDQPLSKIDNPALSDGSACILIKESYGNSFVPFLVPHYQTVYIVDYRYIFKLDARGLSELQAESGAQDIIFLNNMSATRSSELMNYLSNYVR